MRLSHRPENGTLFDIGQEMLAAENATTVAEKWAEKLGRSTQTIFRWVNNGGFYKSGKKRKSNAGQIPPELEEHIWPLAAIYHQIPDKRKPDSKSKMPLWVAKEVYLDSIRPREVELPSDTYLLQLFRKLRISRGDKRLPPPKQRMRTLYPNHAHAYDTGVCDYYLGKDKKIIHIPSAHQYPGKERFDRKRRLVRHIIIDMFSGAFYIQYTFQQKRIDYAEFLFEAMKSKGDFIFHGIPEVLLMDNDVGLRSHVIMEGLALLGVKVPPIEPYRAWVKGVVEERMKTWARVFETRFLLDKSGDIEQINRWAYDYAIKYQKMRAHSRTGMPRFECWDKYIVDAETGESHLKELPDYQTYQQLFYLKPVTRQIDKQGILKYGGKNTVYKVPGMFSVKVDVIEHIYLYRENKAITVMYPSREENPENYLLYEIKKVTVLPAVKAEGGYLESDIVIGEYGKIIKDQRTLNLEKVKETPIPEKLRPFDIPIPPELDIQYIPKTGTPAAITPAVTFDPAVYSKVQVKQKVRALLHRKKLTVQEIEYINNLKGDKFSEEKIKELAELFKEQTLQEQNRRIS